MSSFLNLETNLTEEKNQNFELNMENNKELSELIINIFNQEYEEVFPNILLLSKEIFLSQLKNNIISVIEKIYTEKIKENKNILLLIEENLKKIEEKYENNFNIINNEYMNISKNEQEIKYLNNYRKHCFYDKEFANHNCQNNSKFIFITNDKNKSDLGFVICNICHKVYRTSLILCKCFYCDMEYYTEIMNQKDEIYLFPVAFKHNHCKKLNYNKIPCIKCKDSLYINLKTGMLNCLNKDCNFISESKDFLYKCYKCNTNFNSDVIVYNPLIIKIIEKIINRILLIKNKAYPKSIPCCGLNIEDSTIFYHNINCKGILYLGKYNDDLIIVCEKCLAINYYENFIWTCPKCQNRFKEENNIIIKDIEEDNEDYIIKKENDEDKERNTKMILEKQNDIKKSIKRKYQSFRYRGNNTKSNNISNIIINNNNFQKKISVNLLTIDIINKADTSKINLNENKFNNSTNDLNPFKQKRFSLYKSKKYDLKKFKIPKNYAKLEENKKENKDKINKEKQKDNKDNNVLKDLIPKTKSNINFEKITIDNSKLREGRKSVYQYYKNLKSQKNLKEKLFNEKKDITVENKEKNCEDKNNKKNAIKKFYFDRIKIRRKTMNNPEIKININIDEINLEEDRKKNLDSKSKEIKKEKEKEKNFVCHLNLEEEKIIEKTEEKEFTKNTEIDAKHIYSTEDTNSSHSKSFKVVSKIPGMSDDLYSQIIQQINQILSSCKIPRFNLDEYTINRKIGEGSYGIIHSLIKTKTNEKFALKKIIAQSIQKVSEFVKEFELVNLCQHPNILKIYGLNINLLDHSTYSIQVLMEKAERDWNKDIKRRLQEEKYYTEKELLSIMKQLNLALLYMKEKLNIAHRDIKPQNVLIFENGIFKLADFGEAKEININNNIGTLRGTELYMSPALYNGLKINKDDIEHDPFKSDLFSLGFCFIYAATMDFNLLFNLRNIDNDIEIKKFLKTNLKNRYSDRFICLLTKMLELNEKNRLDFKELDNEIDKIMENE